MLKKYGVADGLPRLSPDYGDVADNCPPHSARNKEEKRMQKVLLMDARRASSFGTKLFFTVKRAFDIVGSLLLLLLLWFPLLIISIVAAYDTKGSPIFIQTRMGLNNRPFRMYKLRTMHISAPEDVATCRLEDPQRYISRIGAFWRRTSIDELPQLLNILRGDMSFVGPRPVVLSETRLISLRTRDGAYCVRPGETGLAQTRGRDTVTSSEKARIDGIYAREASLKMDCRILLSTIGYVLRSQDVCEGVPTTDEAEITSPERSA